MVLSFVQILQESVMKLLPSGEHAIAALPLVAVGAMLGTIILKGIIWFGCMPIKTTQVQALAQDCKTDVIFNTLSLLFPFIGERAGLWWLDPLGAGILSLYIIFDWAGTSFENAIRLSGLAVDLRLQRKLTFLAWRFSPLVEGFKSISAYHAGDGVWMEIDLLLNEKTPLNKAHDIAETLQYCCEGSLPFSLILTPLKGENTKLIRMTRPRRSGQSVHYYRLYRGGTYRACKPKQLTRLH